MGRETALQVRTALAAAMKNRACIVLGQWIVLLGVAAVAFKFAGA
jgi:hypothetical protein